MEDTPPACRLLWMMLLRSGMLKRASFPPVNRAAALMPRGSIELKLCSRLFTSQTIFSIRATEKHALCFFFVCVQWRRGGAIVRKGLCLLILSVLLACLWLASTAVPVFAAPAHVAIPVHQVSRAHPLQRWQRGGRYPGRIGWWRFPHRSYGSQELNQTYRGNSNFNNPIYTVGGHGQGDSGNAGHNRGHNQDNSSNGGNQLVTLHRLRGYHRINQCYYGNSNYNNSVVHRGGYDQGNTGNAGTNDGLNQDNSSNSGNQILN